MYVYFSSGFHMPGYGEPWLSAKISRSGTKRHGPMGPKQGFHLLICTHFTDLNKTRTCIYQLPYIILRLVCSKRVENVQYLPIPSTYTSDMVISATLYNYVAVNLFRTSKWERLPCFEFPFDNRIIFNKSFSNSLISTFISHQQTKSSKKITQHQPNPPKKHIFFSYQQKLQAP